MNEQEWEERARLLISDFERELAALPWWKRVLVRFSYRLFGVDV